ncbi:MAG: Arc family DNA-binding protein [Lachnospiraceae bacterium]|nr:Arc family DNA-binding protein [Lachnospiraceae bacterium]
MSSKYIKGYTDKKSIEYIKNNYDQVSLRMPKGEREKYKNLAEAQGKSLNQLIIDLLDDEVLREAKESKDKRIVAYAKEILKTKRQ